jgi:hypothetical protein
MKEWLCDPTTPSESNLILRGQHLLETPNRQKTLCMSNRAWMV